MTDRLKITIITPVFNEELNLLSYEEAVKRILLARTDVSYNVLFIDDGSVDQSWPLIQEICRRDPRFRGIRLSRNFGSHIALGAGFAHAGDQTVATLACDLQDPPEAVLEFVESWKTGKRIVWGKRRTRDDTAWRMYTSRIFFEMIKRFAMPKGSKFTTGSFFLADREVVRAFLEFKETNRVTFALLAWTGFDQDVVLYDRGKRVAGVSGWNFRKMIQSMFDTLVGFSDLPIRVATWMGILICGCNAIFSFYLIYGWWTSRPLAGWTSVMLLISVFFGIHFLLLGMMGEYLRRIYAESVRRPLYFISDRT
jgi:glycosyltransferase involved in cell wall biosynthesis